MIYLVHGSAQVTRHYRQLADEEDIPLQTFSNADDALYHLVRYAKDIKLVLVGNSLAVGTEAGKENSIFAHEDPAFTGHAFIRRLIEIRPDLPRERIVVFDRALNLQTVRKTFGLARDFGVVSVGAKVASPLTFFTGPGWNVRDHLATLDARR